MDLKVSLVHEEEKRDKNMNNRPGKAGCNLRQGDFPTRSDSIRTAGQDRHGILLVRFLMGN